MIDERAPERFRRLEDRAMAEWGQSFYWRPGDASPERAPNLATIGGPAMTVVTENMSSFS